VRGRRKGRGPGGPVGLLGRLKENGPNGQGLMKKEKKENIIQISKLIARFRKLITKNLVVEIIGKNPRKIVGN
jgi:hypothetical protein